MSSSSESDTQPAREKNANVDVMIELNAAATNEYPHIPWVKNSPLIIKIHEVLRQEVLEKLSVPDRFEASTPQFGRSRTSDSDATSHATKHTPTPT